MSTNTIYSKRNRKAATADCYTYDTIPTPFRIQITHIWRDSIGSEIRNDGTWKSINQILSRELGRHSLGSAHQSNASQCQTFLLIENTEHVLDLLEVAFTIIDLHIRNFPKHIKDSYAIVQEADGAIAELNSRFKEHGLGYQYIKGEIIRIDSQYLHDEAIKPAITLLQDHDFQGAEEEFLSAHKHFREGNSKDAITNALKSFESTLKTICDRLQWQYPSSVTSSGLINLVFENKLIPSELQAHFTAIRGTLDAGVPTIRNKNGGHGQGSTPVEVPDYLTSYSLNITASAIVLLVDCYHAKVNSDKTK